MSQNTGSHVISSAKMRISRNIYACIIGERVGGLELAVAINEDTTAEEYRAAWQQIRVCRDLLHEWQGTDLESSRGLAKGLLLRRWHSHNDLGASYQELAMETNHECLINLCRASILYAKYADSKHDSDKRGFLESMSFAQLHLRAMRLRDSDIAEWTSSGLFEIIDGNAPWTLKMGPVDSQRVRDSLRQLEKEIESGKIGIGKAPSEGLETKTAKPIELLKPIEREAMTLAENLLAKKDDGGGLPQLRKAIERQQQSKRGGKS